MRELDAPGPGSSEADTSSDFTSESPELTPEQALAAMLAEVRAKTQEVKEKEHELEHLCQFWVQRKEPLQANISALSLEAASVKAEMRALQFKITYGRFPPTGPEYFRFVDETAFSVLISAVILANLSTMTLAILDPSKEPLVFSLDYVFFSIYTVELLLRFAYYRRHFLYGPVQVVGWHWLDTFLVVDGLLFLGMYTFGVGSQARSFQYFRLSRVLRYLRFLKLLNQVTKAISSSVDMDGFSAFMLSVIAINSIVMGLEVEYPQLGLVWFWTEHAFLLIFTFELTVLLSALGCRGFFLDCDGIGWRMLDLCIVVCGSVDQWILPLAVIVDGYLGINGISSVPLVHSMQLLRIIRLFRLLRLLKLIRSIRPLYTLIIGVLKAMQGISWVMFLTIMVLYVAALIGVKLVGPGGILVPPEGPEAPEAEHAAAAAVDSWTHASARILHSHSGEGAGSETLGVSTCFPNIFDASFNLFKVMQMDLEPMEPLFRWAPLSKYLIMSYVILTNWAIFSILTAVVSDEMARVTETVENEQQRLDICKQHGKVVSKIFDHLDADGTGEISEREYKQLLADPAAMSEICEAIAFSEGDLEDLFFILSHEKADGKELLISRQDFLDELEKERDVVHNRSIVKLEKRIEHVARRLDHGMRRLEDLFKSSAAPSPR